MIRDTSPMCSVRDLPEKKSTAFIFLPPFPSGTLIKFLDRVLAESPVDEGSLQGMTIAYRELQQPEKICTM